MPKKKFGPDDLLYNTIKSYPQYNFSYYFNRSYINNRETDGQNVQSGSISLFELNVNRGQSEPLIYPFFRKGEGSIPLGFKNVSGAVGELTNSEYKNLAEGTEISSSYPLTSSVARERLIGDGAGPTYTSFEILDGVSETKTVNRLLALENAFNFSKIYSTKFNFSEFYVNGTIDGSKQIQSTIGPQQKHMTMFSIPSIFRGERVKPGSVELNFYVTGTLVGTAKDTKRNGELVETFGPRVSGTIGVINYAEGVMLITGNYVLNSSVTDGYLCPITGTSTTETGPGRVTLQSAWQDNPKWVHFGAYQSFITSSTDPIFRSLWTHFIILRVQI